MSAHVNIAYIATQTSRGWVSTSGWADAIAQRLKNSQERASRIQEFRQPRPSNLMSTSRTGTDRQVRWALGRGVCTIHPDRAV